MKKYKNYISYEGSILELHKGTSYYMCGGLDNSLKNAKKDNVCFGDTGQRIITTNLEEILNRNPIKVIVNDDGDAFIHTIGPDIEISFDGAIHKLNSENSHKVTSNVDIIIESSVIASINLNEDLRNDSVDEDIDFLNTIWKPQDSEDLAKELKETNNISSFFNTAHKRLRPYLNSSLQITIFNTNHENFSNSISSVVNPSNKDEFLEGMKKVEQSVTVYSGDDDYSTTDLIDAVISISREMFGKNSPFVNKIHNNHRYVATPLMLSQNIFAYILITVGSESNISDNEISNLKKITKVIESNLLEILQKDTNKRSRIGNYEKGVTFIDEVNSTVIGRLAKSKSFSDFYGNSNSIVLQRDVFLRKQKNMKFYRRIGDLYFYLTFASAKKSGKFWVSYEISSNTIDFIQESFKHLMFSIRSEILTPNTAYSLPLQHRAAIARSDSEEERGRMKMDFVGEEIDQDFIGEPLNILGSIERFAQPFSILMHRWVARDIAPYMIGFFGGFVDSGKRSYEIKHMISLINLLGLRSLEDENSYKSIIRVWVMDVEEYNNRPLPGMIMGIYNQGAESPIGKKVLDGKIQLKIVVPIDIKKESLNIKIKDPLITFEESYEVELLESNEMIEITDIGNGDEEKLMGYEVIVQLNKTEQKGHENVFLRMMQGNSVGIESEFKYFLKSLKLRNLPAMDNYFTINEELFSYGKTSKQEWDLIWEPVLRKRYEPILTNEFGVFF